MINNVFPVPAISKVNAWTTVLRRMLSLEENGYMYIYD